MIVSKEKSVTLTGIVIPADWNRKQEVIGAALATADEQEYRIRMIGKGKELLGRLQRQIEATCTLDRDKNGRSVITVKGYIVK